MPDHVLALTGDIDDETRQAILKAVEEDDDGDTPREAKRRQVEQLARDVDKNGDVVQQADSSLPYETSNTTFRDDVRTACIKDVDLKTKTVTGYYASWGTLDADNERFDPSAFDESIREDGPNAENQRIKHLYQHDPTGLIGQPSELKSDDFGLYFETPIIDTKLGEDVLKMYQAELLEHSVGFIRKGEEILDDDSVLITKARLMEGSSVTWGANPNTPFLGFKSEQSFLNYLADKAAAMRSLLGEGLHEVRMEQIEIGLRKLESDLRTYKERSENGQEKGEKEGQSSSEEGKVDRQDLILYSMPSINPFKRPEDNESKRLFFPEGSI